MKHASWRPHVNRAQLVRTISLWFNEISSIFRSATNISISQDLNRILGLNHVVWKLPIPIGIWATRLEVFNGPDNLLDTFISLFQFAVFKFPMRGYQHSLGICLSDRSVWKTRVEMEHTSIGQANKHVVLQNFPISVSGLSMQDTSILPR